MAPMSLVYQVHQWARQQKQIWKYPESVRPVINYEGRQCEGRQATGG
jgi:hypothetical protein